MKVKRETLSSG